jgi:hypothetical protein
LSKGEQILLQQGKYSVNLGQGRSIHIGDRIYQGADAETIRSIVRTIIKKLQTKSSEKTPNPNNAVLGDIGLMKNSPIDVDRNLQEELQQLQRDA